jgi:hypothetical protein
MELAFRSKPARSFGKGKNSRMKERCCLHFGFEADSPLPTGVTHIASYERDSDGDMPWLRFCRNRFPHFT